MSINLELTLVQTCTACPEQYDVMQGEDLVGYLRLRHGYFYAECYPKTGGNERVYESLTVGDGTFDPDERELHLNKALDAIRAELSKTSS